MNISVTFPLTPTLAQALEDLAFARGKKRSQLLREIVAREVNENYSTIETYRKLRAKLEQSKTAD